MRTTYLVCYDIADDKRLRKVFKTCGNFGDHLQFSVFECDLNPSEKVELETALGEIINHDEDQVIFVGFGQSLIDRLQSKTLSCASATSKQGDEVSGVQDSFDGLFLVVRQSIGNEVRSQRPKLRNPIMGQ